MTVEYILLAVAIGIVLLVAYRKRVFARWLEKQEPEGWFAGPLVQGKNQSGPVKVTGASFVFPTGGKGIHYFTKARGPITGTAIPVSFRVTADPGVKFVSVEDGSPGTVSVFFSAGDVDWFAEDYSRWYCPIEFRTDLAPGDYTFDVPLDGLWYSAISSNSDMAPAEFRAALAQGGRFGFVFGGYEGRGHGAYATGHATFTAA